jgi:hypothetical protein
VSTATAASRPLATASGNGRRLEARSPKKRLLIVVNPYATTVSDRLKNLVVYALQGRYEVEAVATEAQNHATEIGREAIDGGYDVVVAFGGDGAMRSSLDSPLWNVASYRHSKVDGHSTERPPGSRGGAHARDGDRQPG